MILANMKRFFIPRGACEDAGASTEAFQRRALER
jgi:hypothetical protein